MICQQPINTKIHPATTSMGVVSVVRIIISLRSACVVSGILTLFCEIKVSPVVKVSTDVIPVAGDTEVNLAVCTASKAAPAAEVTWSLGALTDSVKVKTNLSVDPEGTYTLISYLIGVASKDLNKQKVHCLIKHPALNQELVLDHSLIVYSVRVIGRDVNATAGSDAHLSCQLADTTEPITSVTFQRRTKEKPTNTDIFVVTSDDKEENLLQDKVKFIGNFAQLNGSILLNRITLLDEGIYTCIINIFPSGPFEKEIHLQVLVPPVVNISTDVIPVAGDTEVNLAVCTASKAAPAAEVTWSLGALTDSVKVKTNLSVDPEGTYTVISYLIGVASKDLNEQKVQCLIKHPALNQELVLDHSLIVYYPPHDVYIVSTGSQKETHSLQCVAESNPTASNFIWTRTFPQNHALSSNVNGSSLSIQRTPDSNGLYFCRASNPYGSAVGSLYVYVTAPVESKTYWVLFSLLLVVVIVVVGVWYFWKCKWTENVRSRDFKCCKFQLFCSTDDSVPANPSTPSDTAVDVEEIATQQPLLNLLQFDTKRKPNNQNTMY